MLWVLRRVLRVLNSWGLEISNLGDIFWAVCYKRNFVINFIKFL
jgi:hypothetical protein